MEKIFLSIASYRDPELIPTLKDCLARAKHPNRLVFGVCWQRDETESLSEFAADPRFKIIDVPYREARGPCWARHRLQRLWAGEEYVLQLDSHHRFIQDWDQACIAAIGQLQAKGHRKPLLTAYVSSYDPQHDPAGRIDVPWWLTFDKYAPEGAVLFMPAAIPHWENLSEPVPARFFSAHFAFTLGRWCEEVPYDPEYYFHGEEISLAVRSYTHGYDLFAPHRIIAWHEYSRKGRTKQWDDDRTWADKNDRCHLRNRKLFGIDGEPQDIDFGVYGFGTERSLEDYENYAGVKFGKRAVQQYTLDNQIPPNPPGAKFLGESERCGCSAEVADYLWGSAPEIVVL